MRTGFAALKFGATLALIPFSFVYMPELLQQGAPLDIAVVALRYLAGYAALAMGIQQTEFFFGAIAQWRLGLFIGAAMMLLFPLFPGSSWAGAALAALAWAPSLAAFRTAQGRV